jgi:hypothetical protein
VTSLGTISQECITNKSCTLVVFSKLEGSQGRTGDFWPVFGLPAISKC